MKSLLLASDTNPELNSFLKNMDADSLIDSSERFPILDQALKNRAESFLKSEGVLQYGFVDLRQVPENLLIADWLNRGLHGEMDWMERTSHLRSNTHGAFPQYPTALMVCVSYDSKESRSESEKNKISIYAQGRDYHKVIKKILKGVFLSLKELEPRLEGRIFVDSGPVSEKYLAAHAGIGWIGKNTNLISARHGSFFFLGTLLLNCTCSYFKRPLDHCGTCTRCIDACPTNAIIKPYILDAKLCLSYETIEKKTVTDSNLLKLGDWIFGCDDCQTVCPYNRFSEPTPISDFYPRGYTIDYFLKMTETEFLKLFEGSALRRPGYEHFMENVIVQAAKNPLQYKEQLEVLYAKTTNPRIRKCIEKIGA